MNRRIPNSIRSKISKKYIDWAEKLPRMVKQEDSIGALSDAPANANGSTQASPKFYSESIAYLQWVREEQRNEAEKTFKETRLPQGVEVELLFFRLIEIFHVEDFERLHTGIRRLFPRSNYDLLYEDFSSRFWETAGPLRLGGGMRLGVIAQNNTTWIGKARDRVMPELPQEVHYIDLTLHKVLPSVFVVTFDVHLTQVATDRILALHNSQYLPSISFLHLFPLRGDRTGYTGTTSEREMQQAIKSYLNHLYSRVEACIKPFLSGYFLQQPVDTIATLPVFEVYTLQGISEEAQIDNLWNGSARRWGDSFSFNFLSDVFSDNKVIFSSTERHRWPSDVPLYRPVYHTIVLRELFLHSIDTSLFGGDEKHAIKRHIQDMLTQLLPSLATFEFIRAAERNVSRLKQLALKRMKYRTRWETYIRINNDIQQEYMLLERVTTEFELWINLIQRMTQIGLELEAVGLVKTNPVSNLSNDLIKGIRFRTNHLKQQLEHVKTWFSNYITVRNMVVMYRIQWVILWLTIIVGIATIVGVVVSWENFLEFLQ